MKTLILATALWIAALGLGLLLAVHVNPVAGLLWAGGCIFGTALATLINRLTALAEDDDVPMPWHPHTGQWLDVDGEPVHLLADPDIDPRTTEALRELVRAVRKQMDQKR